MVKDPAELLTRGAEPLLENLRRALSQLHERLASAETDVGALKAGQSSVVDGLVNQITNQFSELFTSADQLVQAIRNGEFLAATTATPVTFAVGLQATLLLDVGGSFPFLPSSVVGLTPLDSSDDFAFARVLGWVPSTRQLSLEIFAAAGAVGPHTGVTVEIGALNTLAQETMRADVEAKYAGILDMHQEVVAASDLLVAAAGALQEGPVLSVNGKLGAVSLQAHEIPLEGGASDVQAALDGHAAALDGHATALATKLDISAKASQPQAEAGADNTAYMTPLSAAQAIAALAPRLDVTKDVFTSSGAFTKDADDVAYYVEAWGAGGSGCVSVLPSSSRQIRGGSGGDFNDGFLIASDVSPSEMVTIGAGGAAVTATGPNGYSAGNAGGNTSFGLHLTARGGAGGLMTTSESNGADRSTKGGVSPSTHSVASAQAGGAQKGDSIKGGGAGSGATAASNHATAGESSYGGNGGQGVGNGNGTAGSAPGGGGSIAMTSSVGPVTSGAGARGEVRVWRFKKAP